MNSTAVRRSFPTLTKWGGMALAVLLATLACGRSLAVEGMPRPPELERDVQFWIRVYTEADTNSGYLHDEYNLGVVYETLHFAANASQREREREVEDARKRIAAALRRIAAAGDEPLSEADQRIRNLWGPASAARLRDAAEDIRFQLGQADRFKAGLVRSGAWETHIAETLANLGLPAELAVLPHVESSFNPAAYSKVGAAGLWQFMRSTGRRFMRIDGSVDDRLDPFRSTEAAAQLLAYNYRVLGTWPLALTAYNHGAAGVRRAKETLGTDDIVTIVRHYTSPSFGFASRNFYVSFLAALEVDRNPEKYFGPIEKMPEARFQEIAVPGYVSMAALERALRMDRQKLRALNPALLRGVWDGQRRVPKAYRLRLPLETQWTAELLAQRLNPGELYAGQPAPRRYRVKAGDTLAKVADSFGLTSEALARANRLRTSAHLRPGRVLTVPEALAPPLLAASSAAPAAQPAPAVSVRAPAAPAAIPNARLASPVIPAIAPASADVYVVRRGESLSEIAAKFRLSEAALMKLNEIRSRDFLFEGQRLVVRAPEGAPTPAESAPSEVLAAAGAASSSVAPPASAVYVKDTTVPAAAAAVAIVASAEPETAASAGPAETAGAVTPALAERELIEDAAASAAAREDAQSAQPVSAAQAEELSPALGPAAELGQDADPTDYAVGKDGTIQVAAAETLGHYAEWLQVTPKRLRALNRALSHNGPVVIGRRLRLDFHRVSREEFERKRLKFHQTLQAEYFAAHRIIGSEVYIARRGDSLWSITERFAQLPVWLLQEYNPDIDLSEVRPGTQLVMPRIESIAAAQN